jgi:hypothetical protein
MEMKMKMKEHKHENEHEHGHAHSSQVKSSLLSKYFDKTIYVLFVLLRDIMLNLIKNI